MHYNCQFDEIVQLRKTVLKRWVLRLHLKLFKVGVCRSLSSSFNNDEATVHEIDAMNNILYIIWHMAVQTDAVDTVTSETRCSTLFAVSGVELSIKSIIDADDRGLGNNWTALLSWLCDISDVDSESEWLSSGGEMRRFLSTSLPVIGSDKATQSLHI